MMLRDRPAAIFLLGSFYAESLMLAETGASTGAIQIAGTDQQAQLPFFITTCDYTLIGEELFAASAYLSREPLLLGSLKGQDIGKALVLLLIGTAAPKPGALTAQICKTPRNLLTTSAVRASPSTSSATTTFASSRLKRSRYRRPSATGRRVSLHIAFAGRFCPPITGAELVPLRQLRELICLAPQYDYTLFLGEAAAATIDFGAPHLHVG